MEPELDLFSSGHHPQDADPQEARSDSVHSYDSEIMRQPLPEGIDGDLEFRSPSDLIEDDGYWTDTGSFDPHPSAPDADLELSSGDLKNLNSIVTDVSRWLRVEEKLRGPQRDIVLDNRLEGLSWKL